MDKIFQLILERMRCRFHPYLPPNAGWYYYPKHMAELLKMFNPLHIISVTKKVVAVDGVYVRDGRSLREKYSMAREAASVLFGEVEEKIGIGFNCEVSFHKSMIASISLYWGNIWYLVPSIPLKTPRFAYVVDIYNVNNDLFPYEENDDGGGLTAVAAANGEEEKAPEIYVSKKFFRDPKPENAETFGDLCFLSQMREKWSVDKSIPVKYGTPSSIWIYSQNAEKRIVEVLKHTVGLKSFISHGYMELLIGEEEKQTEGWRRLLRLLKEKETEVKICLPNCSGYSY